MLEAAASGIGLFLLKGAGAVTGMASGDFYRPWRISRPTIGVKIRCPGQRPGRFGYREEPGEAPGGVAEPGKRRPRAAPYGN